MRFFLRWHAAGALAAGVAVAVMLPGCTAVTAGQLVQAGYDAAKTTLTSSSGGADAARERTVMNALSVGQEVAPALEAMGVPPKEKSGNLQGYVCYQYSGVYSSTEDAVIVSKNGKIVFFGGSSCKNEMQAANFAAGGKYDSDAAGAGTTASHTSATSGGAPAEPASQVPATPSTAAPASPTPASPTPASTAPAAATPAAATPATTTAPPATTPESTPPASGS